MAGGRPPDTPVTAIQWGTHLKQKTTRTSLGNLAEADIENPAVVVVGPVAGFDISWFENRPLMGHTLAVTRARTQSSDLVSQLQHLGADVIEVPTIEIAEPGSWAEADAQIHQLGAFDWLTFTSVNGVEHFFSRLFKLGYDIRALGHLKLATIGGATTEAIQKYHILVDLEPQKNTSEGLLDAFQDVEQIRDANILIPGPEKNRGVLQGGLQKLGAKAEAVTVYRTVKPKGLPKRFIDLVRVGAIDLITFTSSSTVTNLLDLLSEQNIEASIKGACIGPITAKTAHENGIEVLVTAPAEDVSINRLVDEIKTYLVGND